MEIARGKGMRLVLSLILAVALLGMSAVMAGCDADTTDGDASGDVNGETAAVEADPIEIGWVPWDEDIAVTYLWKHILEGEGYEVNLTQLDIAPVYAGLAEGDLDLYLDAWLPITHADYAEE
jgi:glycine betaine/proline transport system substrate-binding protein